eukprot:scaffold21618_cov63-Attheya_sp.AAC.2
MSESDQKPSATMRSKTQAFDLEALQLLVTSTTQNVDALSTSIAEPKETFAATDKKVSKVMKKMDIQQAIQDDHQDLTTKSITTLQTTIESQPYTIADTVCNDLHNNIDELRDKICDGCFQHEQEVLCNDNLQADLLDKLKQAPNMMRTKSSFSFPRFSASYGGIRSTVPANMTADKYYQDVSYASQPQHSRIIHRSCNSYAYRHDRLEKLAKLHLCDDRSISTAIHDWYHGICLALNTSGKTHIEVLPVHEMLKTPDHFSTLLLPVDALDSIDTSASSYSLCLNMYHTFGQVLLSVLLTTSTSTMFHVATCPKTSRLIQIHCNLCNGWDLLWNILCKSAPHLGGKNENVHDLVLLALSIFLNERNSSRILQPCSQSPEHDHIFSSGHTTNPSYHSVY